MIINKHILIHAKDAGNGYHGNCQHCGLALVTDLGYSSWSNVKCIDRPIIVYQDIPKNIRLYAVFKNLIWDKKTYTFTKPFTNEEYTLDELNKKLNDIPIII